MSLDGGSECKLILGILDGKFDAVKAVLQAGADVNGSSEQLVPPIVAAITADDVDIVDLLLEQGADPDKSVTIELICPDTGVATAILGERALHVAARSGYADIVRLLLEQSRADPNATDNTGYTPLMATCDSSHVCGEVVRLLLEAGADPVLAQEKGLTPLHVVALHGHTDLVDTLHSRAPATLNRCAYKGETPLFLACVGGHDSMVSKLLSLGATQQMVLDASTCPLTVAVSKGFVGVVRVLINEGGLGVVGGWGALAQALHTAICCRRAKILQLLLTVDGEKGRSRWANISIRGRHLLHFAAGFCYPAAVSVLLEAGAVEAAYDAEGCIPRDVIGVDAGRDDVTQIDRGGEVAIHRMLQRGPAHIARSWAWPSDAGEVDVGGRGNGDITAPAYAAAAALLSLPPAVQTPSVLGVRIYRPRQKSGSSFFVRLVGRYCAVD